MPYRWPTDPPGKKPAHSISWEQHQANMAAKNQPKGPPKGLPAGTPPMAAPAPSQGAPTSGGPAQIVPDAQYLAEAAQRAFLRTQEMTRLNQETADDKTNTQTAINRLIEQMSGDLTKINEGANKEGLFYSGQLSKRRGEYEQGVQRQRSDLETGLQQRENARVNARTAIEQGAPLDEAIALAAAGERQVSRDTAAADAGALVANPAPAPRPAPVTVATVRPPRPRRRRPRR